MSLLFWIVFVPAGAHHAACRLAEAIGVAPRR